MTRDAPLVMATHVRREAESSMTPAHNVSQARIYGYCAILVAIWASAFTLVGVAVPHIAPIWLVTYRLIIGSVAVSYTHLRAPRDGLLSRMPSSA